MGCVLQFLANIVLETNETKTLEVRQRVGAVAALFFHLIVCHRFFYEQMSCFVCQFYSVSQSSSYCLTCLETFGGEH